VADPRCDSNFLAKKNRADATGQETQPVEVCRSRKKRNRLKFVGAVGACQWGAPLGGEEAPQGVPPRTSIVL